MWRGTLLAGGWWVLTEGEARAWIVGVPVVLAATWASGKLVPAIRWRWRPLGLLRFAGFFLRHSVTGGIDVAWRALHPRRPLRPGFVVCPIRLPPGAARVWLASVISLLPGTLAVQLEEGHLLVHTVNTAAPVAVNVSRVEDRVADLFGVALAPAGREET